MNWILLKPDEVIDGRVRLVDERAEHIRKVLRAEAGKELRIGLLNGPLGVGTVSEVSSTQVSLRCEFEAEPPPRPQVDLLLAMPRPKVLKRLWSQFAALGVGRILITNAEKVERYYFDTHILDPEFYTPRLIEGLQQAGDTLLPEVKIFRFFKRFLENDLCPDVGRKLVADPSGTQNLTQIMGSKWPENDTENSRKILLGIGPEGGWTSIELDLLEQYGFERFGMGSRVLRTDTASVAILGVISEIQRLGM